MSVMVGAGMACVTAPAVSVILCCSVIQCLTSCYSVLHRVTVCYSMLQPLLRRSSSEKSVINQYNENLRSIQHQEQNHDDHLGYDDEDGLDDNHQSVGCISSFCPAFFLSCPNFGHYQDLNDGDGDAKEDDNDHGHVDDENQGEDENQYNRDDDM